MHKVKEGHDMKNKGDLQNVVTSVILRQITSFSVEDVYKEVMTRLADSEYVNAIEIKEMCENTINELFCVNGLRRSDDGNYDLIISFPAISKR